MFRLSERSVALPWEWGRFFCCRPQPMSCLAPGNGARGPTGVVVWQGSGWTVGILAWHNWSFAGDADRADVDETFLQPVIAYTTSRAWTFTLQGEDTYNWETGEWLAPVNFLVSKIVKVGTAGQHRWRRALLDQLSRRRSPWFRRSAWDDVPVSGAMIARQLQNSRFSCGLGATRPTLTPNCATKWRSSSLTRHQRSAFQPTKTACSPVYLFRKFSGITLTKERMVSRCDCRL